MLSENQYYFLLKKNLKNQKMKIIKISQTILQVKALKFQNLNI